MPDPFEGAWQRCATFLNQLQMWWACPQRWRCSFRMLPTALSRYKRACSQPTSAGRWALCGCLPLSVVHAVLCSLHVTIQLGPLTSGLFRPQFWPLLHDGQIKALLTSSLTFASEEDALAGRSQHPGHRCWLQVQFHESLPHLSLRVALKLHTTTIPGPPHPLPSRSRRDQRIHGDAGHHQPVRRAGHTNTH